MIHVSFCIMGNSEKTPSSRWDLNPRLDHGGPWVQIPSGARSFFRVSHNAKTYHVVISTKRLFGDIHLGYLLILIPNVGEAYWRSYSKIASAIDALKRKKHLIWK